MRRAKKVKALANFLLLIQFDNGENRVYNCFPLLQNPLFEALNEESVFQSVYVDEMGVVCWNASMDINPYDLYEKSEPVTDFAFAG